jgi:hypothetical protein
MQLTAYRTDVDAGKDALLLCDTTEITDALNHRIHHDTIDPTAPTIGIARGQRVAVGDLIISRRNDPTITVLDTTRNEPAAEPVRNGNRWRVYAIDPDRGRITARRLDDDARAAFTGDYLREHITYGYAVTVHSPKASPPTQLTLSSAKTPPVQRFTSRSHVVANPTRPTSISAWWVRLTTSTASAKTSTRRVAAATATPLTCCATSSLLTTRPHRSRCQCRHRARTSS